MGLPRVGGTRGWGVRSVADCARELSVSRNTRFQVEAGRSPIKSVAVTIDQVECPICLEMLSHEQLRLAGEQRCPLFGTDGPGRERPGEPDQDVAVPQAPKQPPVPLGSWLEPVPDHSRIQIVCATTEHLILLIPLARRHWPHRRRVTDLHLGRERLGEGFDVGTGLGLRSCQEWTTLREQIWSGAYGQREVSEIVSRIVW